MIVTLGPVEMVGRVWMESTHLHVDVKMDLLVNSVRQVSYSMLSLNNIIHPNTPCRLGWE